MRTQRDLTDDEKNELKNLNDAVSAAIEARRDWLDVKMHECSRLKIGDDIYDIHKGIRLGTVARLYRYWSGRNDLLDKSVDCDCEYQTSSNCFDNTSRQTGILFGTKEEAADYAERRASRLRMGL
jgi:hypothetical protein